jgi:predicted outer membrane repeat protein
VLYLYQSRLALAGGAGDTMMLTIWENNRANGTGGAIHAVYSNIATSSGNLLFRNNIAMVGSAVENILTALKPMYSMILVSCCIFS